MAIKDGDKGPQISNAIQPHVITVPPDGMQIGASASDKLSLHGASPAAQRSGAAQAAVATTAATNSAPYGFTTAAQANALVTLANEIRAALVEKGIIKGS